jgi:hypothetical protein
MVSWRDASSVVSFAGVPPLAGTVYSEPATKSLENTIAPLLLQEPPTPGEQSQIVCAACSARERRFSAWSAKNAIERPSGDQNGYCPPSVPRSGSGLSESMD